MQPSDPFNMEHCVSIRRLPVGKVRPAARRAPALAVAAAALAVGCGVLTTIPLDQLTEGNPAGRLFPFIHPPYATGEVIFSHEPHSHVECAVCHPGGGEAGTVRREGLPSMARCYECHDGEHAGAACETCHQLERRGRKPGTHDAAWQRRHGADARGQSDQCALCHLEPDCQGCHATRRPQSHTLRFARSTHGRMANHDRSSCATCHQGDFCANCHRNPPPDHTATFTMAGGHKQAARLRARSCLTCHQFPQDCARCHGG